jgi:hypothetical protein
MKKLVLKCCEEGGAGMKKRYRSAWIAATALVHIGSFCLLMSFAMGARPYQIGAASSGAFPRWICVHRSDAPRYRNWDNAYSADGIYERLRGVAGTGLQLELPAVPRSSSARAGDPVSESAGQEKIPSRAALRYGTKHRPYSISSIARMKHGALRISRKEIGCSDSREPGLFP